MESRQWVGDAGHKVTLLNRLTAVGGIDWVWPMPGVETLQPQTSVITLCEQ